MVKEKARLVVVGRVLIDNVNFPFLRTQALPQTISDQRTSCASTQNKDRFHPLPLLIAADEQLRAKCPSPNRCGEKPD